MCFTAVIACLIQVYAMSVHGKTDSEMPEGEEVEARGARSRPFIKVFNQALGSRQRPTYVFVVHLLGHNFSV